MPYHVDAVTLQPFGEGWEDEMAMGRVIESTFRSLNNLLEHLHQSFFFYLLMESRRFVSIGTYLPSAMLVATSFSIMAIFMWLQSGAAKKRAVPVKVADVLDHKIEAKIVHEGDMKAIVPADIIAVEERHIFLPMTVVAGLYFLGALPLYLFNLAPKSVRSPPTIGILSSLFIAN